jgi:hypothetical protein
MRKPIGVTVPYRAPEFNEIERRSKVKQTLIVESKEARLLAEIAALTEVVRVLSARVEELEGR